MSKREIFLSLMRSSGLIKVPVRTGTVSDINASANTCTVTLSTGAQVFNVQLQAITNGSAGVIVVPVDGSTVLIEMVEGLDAQWVIISTSTVDSFSIFTTGAKLEVLKNGNLQLNGTKVNGQASWVPELNALVQKINRLENTMNIHQHVAPTGGGVTTPNGSQTIAPVTAVADLANTKITQGDGT